jgi:HSP20 family protein
MTLIRWATPRPSVRGFVGTHEEINRLMDGVLAGSGSSSGSEFAPLVDIAESPTAFVIRADLPGIAPADVKVSLQGDTLTLRGERRRETAAEGDVTLRIERPAGTFERSFILGAPVRTDAVKAVYRDGVLEIQVPKADSARSLDIEVQAG